MNRPIPHSTCVLIIFSLLLLFNRSNSQPADQYSFWNYTRQTISDDTYHAFHVGIGIVTAPTRIETNDMLWVTGTAGITGTLFLLDQSVKKSVLKNKSSFNDKLFKIDEYFNGTTATYTSAGIWLTGFFMVEENLRRTGLYAIETLFIALSVTAIIKFLSGRRRPYAGKDNMDFKITRGSKERYRSFPSGHTTSAFAFSSVMAKSVDNIYWKTFWYGSAGLVGLARIYHNVHWLSDTLIAAAMSYTIADYVVNYDSGHEKQFSIQPHINGLSLKIHF